MVEANIRVSAHSDVPIYRQIVAQVTFMIEMGHLRDGDRLPGSRLLADNLGINRNTVAHAYALLRDGGLVEAKGRNGMVVIGGERARTSSATRERAREIIERAIRECSELGLGPEDIHDLVTSISGGVASFVPRVAFVECNADRAKYFAEELDGHLDMSVTPLVLGDFVAEAVESELVLTTFFHLAEVRRLFRGTGAEVVAIVVAPHLQTLVQIAQVPKSRTVGVWYSTEDQAAGVRDSFAQTGVTNVRVIESGTDEELDGVDLVVVPTETPAIKQQLEGRVRILEYGNVLDAASLRMVEEVIRELQLAHASRPRHAVSAG
ncbi:GntR family transcriptional regulator [Microbacterium tumbae]